MATASVRFRGPRLLSARAALQWAGATAAVLTWQVGAELRVWDPAYIPAPSSVVAAMPSLIVDGPLIGDTLASLRSIAIGLGLATVAGSTAGILSYRVAAVGWFISPLVEMTRGIAPLALLPAFLVIVGIGHKAAIAIVVWVAWPVVLIATVTGLRDIDGDILLAARSMGARGFRLITSVYFMAARGTLFAGLRIAYGSAWLAVVAAEMLGSSAGLGFRVLEHSQTFHIVEMYATITVIGFLSMGGTALLNALESRAISSAK